MKGHRIFDRFGFDLPEGKAIPEPKLQTVEDYQELKFQAGLCDWVNPENGQRLTGYLPPQELLGILEKNIDISSE